MPAVGVGQAAGAAVPGGGSAASWASPPAPHLPLHAPGWFQLFSLRPQPLPAGPCRPSATSITAGPCRPLPSRLAGPLGLSCTRNLDRSGHFSSGVGLSECLHGPGIKRSSLLETNSGWFENVKKSISNCIAKQAAVPEQRGRERLAVRAQNLRFLVQKLSRI